jgi:hypothetical protein
MSSKPGTIIRKLVAAATAAGLGLGLAVAATSAAQAAVPNAWAFAFVRSPVGPVDATHWAESVASPTPTAASIGPGVEVVRFRNVGHVKGGVVHTTAVTDQLAWCQAVGWRPLGGSEYVTVRCFRKGGVPVFVPFTVTFSQSSGTLPGGLSYAYLHYSAGIVSAYNSKGLANAVTPAGTGSWLVRLHGPGPASAAGGIQVTAVSKLPRICDVAGWARTPAQQIIKVKCYNPAGVPAGSGWTLSYQRGRAITGTRPHRFAYTFNTKPLLAGPYAPGPAGVNFNSAGAINTIQRSGLAESLVRFRRVGFLPNTVLVTAAATGARVCNLNTSWATTASREVIVRDVVCYKATGGMAPTQSLVSYTSKH